MQNANLAAKAANERLEIGHLGDNPTIVDLQNLANTGNRLAQERVFDMLEDERYENLHESFVRKMEESQRKLVELLQSYGDNDKVVWYTYANRPQKFGVHKGTVGELIHAIQAYDLTSGKGRREWMESSEMRAITVLQIGGETYEPNDPVAKQQKRTQQLTEMLEEDAKWEN